MEDVMERRQVQLGASRRNGNTSPRFPWVGLPEGRTALVAVLCIGRHMGYLDNVVLKDRKLPPARDFHDVFLALLPCFPDTYDETRKQRALEIAYRGPLTPFNSGDPHNRFRYFYVDPPRPKAGLPRRHGLGQLHPLSDEQAKPGKLREVYVRCASTIDARLHQGQPITREEAVAWGRRLGDTDQ